MVTDCDNTILEKYHLKVKQFEIVSLHNVNNVENHNSACEVLVATQ